LCDLVTDNFVDFSYTKGRIKADQIYRRKNESLGKVYVFNYWPHHPHHCWVSPHRAWFIGYTWMGGNNPGNRRCLAVGGWIVRLLRNCATVWRTTEWQAGANKQLTSRYTVGMLAEIGAMDYYAPVSANALGKI
jgi:hypothetical protein